MHIFQAPLCKGSSAAGGEGLFFYNPSRRRLQACFAHSQIPPTASRFPNPSRRGLQACSAYLQIPCVKGAPPKAVRDCFFTTRLGDACKCASHTRKSLQPLRGFRTRLGDACKRASHTRKSLYTREPFNQSAALPHLFSLIFSYLLSPRSGSFDLLRIFTAHKKDIPSF